MKQRREEINAGIPLKGVMADHKIANHLYEQRWLAAAKSLVDSRKKRLA
ncbi:MAG: hypothetical protein ACYDEV_11310 [Acidiferrobacter sp.]